MPGILREVNYFVVLLIRIFTRFLAVVEKDIFAIYQILLLKCLDGFHKIFSICLLIERFRAAWIPTFRHVSVYIDDQHFLRAFVYDGEYCRVLMNKKRTGVEAAAT